jgi:hypothetical protein
LGDFLKVLVGCKNRQQQEAARHAESLAAEEKLNAEKLRREEIMLANEKKMQQQKLDVS